MTVRTRFAPSPTGPLHLGHAYSAMLGFGIAMEEGGEWLLRIEDIDRQRSKPEWEQGIFDDLEWLGLWWPEPVMRQSERGEAYAEAQSRLWRENLLYPCSCSRRDISEALAAPQGSDGHLGPDGLVYPRTCFGKDSSEWKFPFRDEYPRPVDETLRLDMGAAALRVTEHSLRGPDAWRWNFEFHETGSGPNGECGCIETTREALLHQVGDVVLARRGMGTSYHLSVVLDDAAQGITHVVRGQDLFEATRIHVVLQKLLGLPTPTYHHHRLIRDEAGRRLAKREDAKAIRRFREEGATPRDIRRMVGLDPDRGP